MIASISLSASKDSEISVYILVRYCHHRRGSGWSRDVSEEELIFGNIPFPVLFLGTS